MDDSDALTRWQLLLCDGDRVKILRSLDFLDYINVEVIAEITNRDLDLARAQLEILAECGILKKHSSGGQSTYKVNREDQWARNVLGFISFFETDIHSLDIPPVETLFASKDRVTIMKILAEAERISGSEISRRSQIPPQAATEHLTYLVGAGIARAVHYGPVTMYRWAIEAIHTRALENYLKLRIRSPPEVAPADEVRPNTIFRNKDILTDKYWTFWISKHLHLEQYHRMLHKDFDLSYLDAPTSHNIIISGPRGSGKTALVRKFGYDLQSIIDDDFFCTTWIEYIYIDCQQINTPLRLMEHILQIMVPNFPPLDREGITLETSLTILSEHILKRENAYILLCLDDGDLFFKKEPAFIPNLLRKAESRISLIVTARSLSFLDQLNVSLHWHHRMTLPSYSQKQLRDILAGRIAAFVEGAIPGEVLDLIAEAAAVSGDAGYALRLLLEAGEAADLSESPQVQPAHVLQAKNVIKL
ncbi:MAG: hypothetical protein HWN65_08060 [Candidatus Helarchaeota archaeon]|nr:hypothetical protein [Candidatus Helarchaeota archaeon]